MRFGVVGTNWITDAFVEAALLHEEFELVAVYSRKKETGRVFADKYGVRDVFTDLDEMCASGLIDAVYIASPNYVHAAQSILAARHGVHVLCEKPATTSVEEFDEVVAAAHANGVLYMEGMRHTVTPNFLAIKDHLHKLGAIRRVVFHFNQYSSRYDKFKDGIIENAFKPELGNGAKMDLGVYCLASLVHLFGMPKHLLENEYLLSSGAVGQGTMVLTYDEFEVVVMYSKITDSYYPGEIQGELGVMEIDKVSSPEKIVIRYRSGETEDISVKREKPWMYDEVAEFIHCAKEGLIESPINSHARTRQVISLLNCKQ